MTEDVRLFWPLLLSQGITGKLFPTQLRSETEQWLAVEQWQAKYPGRDSALNPTQRSRLVRNLLDLGQLAGAAGWSDRQVLARLTAGELRITPGEISPEEAIAFWQHWRQWCLGRGFITYGLIFSCYGEYLLKNSQYQRYLRQSYDTIFADDVDDYPAIALDLFDQLRPHCSQAVFSFNPDGQVRLGLNADPNALAVIAQWGQEERLERPTGIAPQLSQQVLTLMADPRSPGPLPSQVQALQTFSRAQLLRQITDQIIAAVEAKEVKPQDIAIIAPGLDEIARYSFLEIFNKAGIDTIVLNEQRPLSSAPLIRSLLTLLALLYDLGEWARREQVAEMLVVLGERRSGGQTKLAIDPVRAGLLADTCYAINPEAPALMPIEQYPRWDRFGYQASQAYGALRQWLTEQKQVLAQEPLSPVTMLDRAIREQLPPEHQLSYGELASLRELMETLQHFGQVQGKLQGSVGDWGEDLIQIRSKLALFLQLLSQGTVTAQPRPDIPDWLPSPPAITLATIYQYRSLRSQHRWHFWLDAGDRLWEMGGASQLFGAPLLLRRREPKPWTQEEQQQWDQERFERIVRDLLARVTEKLVLCHSEISVRGTEQVGKLLNIIQRAENLSAFD
ncbi:hypothetical protein KQ311_03930 [Synechocystis sp. CS-94]|nr:hypothetical protein [Synechocystis sp. CS-94]